MSVSNSTPRHVQLQAAVRLIERAEVQCHIVGEHDAADRIALLNRRLADEAELQAGIERRWFPSPKKWAPPAATIGWFLRFDAQTRRARELRGLPNPPVGLPVAVRGDEHLASEEAADAA